MGEGPKTYGEHVCTEMGFLPTPSTQAHTHINPGSWHHKNLEFKPSLSLVGSKGTDWFSVEGLLSDSCHNFSFLLSPVMMISDGRLVPRSYIIDLAQKCFQKSLFLTKQHESHGASGY